MTAPIHAQSSEAQAQRLERVSEQLSILLNQPDIAQRLRTAPGEHEWSALQVIGHMVEMIPYWLHHCRRLIAASAEPPQFGRTLDAPERLAGVEAVATSDAGELLGRVKQVVEAAANDIRHMSDAERSKTGIHVGYGQMTVADVIEQLIVRHAEAHVAQVQGALQT
jgi:DinB superfamily